MPEHVGVDYITFMEYMARVLRPTSYFEIGTNTGNTLIPFPCDAVCVDPQFQISRDVIARRKRTFFFQMTSDEFFAENNLSIFFPHGVDMVFLDGLHRFEFLLRDFINTEKFCHKGSIMLMHDCLPYDVAITPRALIWADWAGDVCKILPILKKYRPDLRIHLLDAPPTGLVACTDLNPHSQILAENYHKIVDEFFSYSLTNDSVEELLTMFPRVDTRRLMEHPEDLTAIFPHFIGWKGL
jgi:hypothetical protein